MVRHIIEQMGRHRGARGRSAVGSYGPGGGEDAAPLPGPTTVSRGTRAFKGGALSSSATREKGPPFARLARMAR